MRRSRRGPAGAVRANVGRQIVGLDETFGSRHRAALDDVLEFADVARPGVVHHRGEGFRADFLRDETAVGREAGQKVLDEQRDVVLALAQRRHDQMDDVEPVEEVFAELPLRDHVAQVPVGRRDHAHVRRGRAVWSAPTFWNSPVSRNRSSRPCIRSVISPISSRKMVP